MDNIVLGAGISGIGSGYALGSNSVIFEARDSYGGLCDNFTLEGFLFDTAIHLSFANEAKVREVFDEVKYFKHYPDILNFFDNIWTKHPLQANLFRVSIEEKIKIIES
jgi:protoporphyrinogen oxidase